MIDDTANTTPIKNRLPRPDWFRSLGHTGLRVSAICLGGSPLGSMPEAFGYPVSEADGIAMATAALDSPVRWIDTANGYSDGESERRIGAAIRDHGGLPEDFWVATKVDARDGDYSGARVRASVAESKGRLGLDRLPLVYLHDPEFHDFAELTAPDGAVATLMRLREEGEIEHVGLAGGDVHEMARYLELGGFEVLLTHNRWTLVDHSAEQLLSQAEDQGVAVVNAAIYGGGLLAAPTAGKTSYGYRPAPPELLSAVQQMAAACRADDTDLPTVALQISLADPRIAATVIGMSRPSRLSDALAAASAELDAGLAARLAALLPPAHTWLDHRA